MAIQTSEQRLAYIDGIIAAIKISMDEHQRGGKEMPDDPEQDLKHKYKQERMRNHGIQD